MKSSIWGLGSLRPAGRGRLRMLRRALVCGWGARGTAQNKFHNQTVEKWTILWESLRDLAGTWCHQPLPVRL